MNITVTAKDSAGHPVQGAMVCSDQAGLGCVATDAHGKAVLTGLAVGAHIIFVNAVERGHCNAPGAVTITI
jgi:hypothetical protein